MAQIESILTSVKKALGIDEGYEHFDPDLIMHINSSFATLHQLGVGPNETFSITDKSSVWSDFTQSKTKLNLVQTYVYLRVRLLFDPPSNSFVTDSIKEQIQELSWRLNAADDPAYDYQ